MDILTAKNKDQSGTDRSLSLGGGERLGKVESIATVPQAKVG